MLHEKTEISGNRGLLETASEHCEHNIRSRHLPTLRIELHRLQLALALFNAQRIRLEDRDTDAWHRMVVPASTEPAKRLCVSRQSTVSCSPTPGAVQQDCTAHLQHSAQCQ